MAKIEGEIKDLTSFSKALSGMKLITISVAGASVLGMVIVFVMYVSQLGEMNHQVIEARSQHFVIEPTSGHILKGSFRALNVGDREKMLKALVGRFVDCWYDFDGETFKENLKTGLNYSSQEVSNVFLAEYLKSDFDLGHKLKDEKMNWYCYVDSVALNMESMIGTFHGKQKIVKPYGQKWIKLVARFQIRELDQVTDKNEYAAVIDKWKIVEQVELGE